jgi:hypothetical protein
MWGTIYLVVGAVQLLTSLLIFLVLDGVVIYALTVYGDALRTTS